MEGTENSSNSGAAGSQTESKATESKATESKATETSKSSGNFSGGFNSSALSDKSLSTDSTPDFGVDFGTNNNKSFGFGDNLFGDSGFDFGKGISDSGSSKTSETVNKPEPVMTVDEVYGKGNQSIVERQGDYAASSNEKSNVETSTFGKQDEISVTPLSVTEDKGLVNNDAIQSVEGLDFQQKDKASQDVMEAKKSRDEAEAEDKTNQMKDSLLSKIGKPIGKPGNGDVSQFQLGDRNEDVAAAQADLDAKNKAVTDLQNELTGLKEKQVELGDWETLDRDITQAEEKLDAADKEIERLKDLTSFAEGFGSTGLLNDLSPNFNTWKNEVLKTAKSLDWDTESLEYAIGYGKSHLIQKEAKEILAEASKQAREEFDVASAKLSQAHAVAARYEEFESEILNAEGRLEQAVENQKNAQAAYDNLKNSSFVGEETVTTETPTTTPVEETPATTTPVETSNAEKALAKARETVNNSDLTAEQKAELQESLDRVEQSIQKVQDAAAKARSGNQADLVAYENAVGEYNKNLKDALNRGIAITQTDLNKAFTRSVADANDFDVTLADGTTMKYDKFAIEEAAKSPDYAEAIYNQQADDYAKKAATATNGIMKTYYNVKSELASWKAQLSKDWLGSKVVGADNAFRNQFIQMAKTDERATVNAYNDILNDKTGKYSEAYKAEASAALNQSKSLMTAATALKYSTGTLSGIGDDVKDGTYGTTNPELLKTHQKIISKVDNIAKITLGLVVTPAANEGWANMYYMAGDKASQSSIFNRDWDKDGISMTREYGNNATAGIIGAICELGLGIALSFSPSTMVNGADLIMDSGKTFIDSLYGVRKAAKNAVKANNEILGYFNEARDIVKSSGNEDAIKAIDDAASMFLTQTKQTEDFQLKSDEVGNLDNWLEGSGSNAADNGKFNQALTYDEWLKLIEADPVMQEYAKSLNR